MSKLNVSRAIVFILLVLGTLISCNKNSIHPALQMDMIKSFAEEASIGTPREIDEVTTLEHVKAHQMNVIYSYTMRIHLLDYAVGVHKVLDKESFVNYMCKTPRFHDELLKNGVNLVYRYSDTEGNQIAEFVFSVKDC